MKRCLVVCVLCAVALAGCFSPRRDDSKFFVLSPVTGNGAATAASSRPIVIGLGPVKLPAYLDRQEVVTRVAPNRLDLSSVDRWAEPLDTDFSRVLAQDLSSDLGTQRITSFPWYNTTHVDYQVKVDVYRFERDQQGKVELTTHWEILDGTGKILVARDSSYSETASSSEASASAAAMSSALGRLSQDIASAIQSAPQPPQPASHA
jgi:uncharacterized lipoprotein YmbA